MNGGSQFTVNLPSPLFDEKDVGEQASNEILGEYTVLYRTNVRTEQSVSSKTKKKLRAGVTVNVVDIAHSDGHTRGRIGEGKWVSLRTAHGRNLLVPGSGSAAAKAAKILRHGMVGLLVCLLATLSYWGATDDSYEGPEMYWGYIYESEGSDNSDSEKFGHWDTIPAVPTFRPGRCESMQLPAEDRGARLTAETTANGVTLQACLDTCMAFYLSNGEHENTGCGFETSVDLLAWPALELGTVGNCEVYNGADGGVRSFPREMLSLGYAPEEWAYCLVLDGTAQVCALHASALLLLLYCNCEAFSSRVFQSCRPALSHV